MEAKKVAPAPIMLEPAEKGKEKEVQEVTRTTPRPPAEVKEEIKRRATAKMEKLISKLIDAWEKDYLKQKAKNMENLHNDLMEVIGYHINNGTPIDTVCFVLDVVKYEITTEKLRQIYEGKSIEKVMG